MLGLPESFKYRVHFAARDGMAITLFTLLSEKTSDEVQEVLNEPLIQEDGQRCTPLIVASRFGHDKAVKMLLCSKFSPDLEQEGTVRCDGCVIDGASALWCAAGAGHLNVVKSLVKAGANVNHPTSSSSTPLRAACFDGRLDIVKYLTDHYADIHMANKYNNTCLMIAAFKGHLDVVSFLLENGANPDERAHCGATALHFAAECGHLAIVRELLKYNAKITKNDTGMTALLTAAERTKAEVVEFLISRPEVCKAERIEALELLGASFANDKDNYCIELAFKYLYDAMELRFDDTSKVLEKDAITPVEAYESRVECRTLPELEAIRLNQNAIHMEALAIRERILGSSNPEVPHPIVFRGAVFADHARFDRCIELWLHALELRKQNGTTLVKDLLRFAQVFSQMLHVGLDVSFKHVTMVLEACAVELQRNKDKIANPGPKDDVETITEEMESNLTTTLYLLSILTKLLKHCNEMEKFDINRLVFSLTQLQVSLHDGQTLLHLAVNAETPVDDFHTNDVCKFPCAETTRLLILCGADVNAMDMERNTPLHIIVSYQKPISDFLTLHSIIMDLTEAGAHMDSVNARGETPFDSSATGKQGVAEIILKTQAKLSLKCMAAKAVKTYNLTYQGKVPQSLENFIELHGPGAVKQG